MEINANTKIDDLLKEYPFLEDFLVDLSPKFKGLKNPICLLYTSDAADESSSV